MTTDAAEEKPSHRSNLGEAAMTYKLCWDKPWSSSINPTFSLETYSRTI